MYYRWSNGSLLKEWSLEMVISCADGRAVGRPHTVLGAPVLARVPHVTFPCLLSQTSQNAGDLLTGGGRSISLTPGSAGC